MSNTAKINLSDISRRTQRYIAVVRPYTFVIFLVFAAVLYGFLVLRINELSNSEPTDAAISDQVQTTRLTHIDENVVKKLQSLRDNSVNVEALFNQARNNPFE